MSDSPEETVPPEVFNRVVYALLAPAVRLALNFEVSVKDLTRWLHMAYYQEARSRGMKNREIAESLGVSMRKLAALSSQLKRNFLPEEDLHKLPRRIEYMLWAGPLSSARIKQTLPEIDPPERVDEALEMLIKQGRIRALEDRLQRFEVVKSEFRLVDDELGARLDGLGNLTSSVSNAVYSRFFAGPSVPAFARTLSFRVRKASVARLRKLYDEVIWETLRKLDEEASGEPDEDVEQIDLSLLWAPHEFLRAKLKAELMARRRRETTENS